MPRATPSVIALLFTFHLLYSGPNVPLLLLLISARKPSLPQKPFSSKLYKARSRIAQGYTLSGSRSRHASFAKLTRTQMSALTISIDIFK